MYSGRKILTRMRSGVEVNNLVVLEHSLRYQQCCTCENNWSQGIQRRKIDGLFSKRSSLVAGRL